MKDKYRWVIVFTDRNGNEIEKYRYLDRYSIEDDLKRDLQSLAKKYKYEIKEL